MPEWRNWLYAHDSKSCGLTTMWVRLPPRAPHMNTTTLIILVAILNGMFSIFVSRASGKIDINLSPFIFNSLGALVPLSAYWFLRIARPLEITATKTSGIVFSVLAGISIALFSILLLKIFSRGSDLSYVFPIIYGGTVVVSTLGGLILFKEQVSVLQVVGIISIISGLVLVTISKF